ncbi:MAG: lipocalin family protein [bacterium]
MKKISFLICAALVVVCFGCAISHSAGSTAKKPAAAKTKTAKKAAKAPAGPALNANKQFYKDEGAHFELPYEQWVAHGRLIGPDGKPFYFASVFHKTGEQFMQARNGYNALRLPDGKYDYRSYGQGMIRTLASNLLKDKAKKYPDVAAFRELGEKLVTGDSLHFETLPDNAYPLYRGRLYMKFGQNLFERVSENQFLYKLDLETWAGPLKLNLKSAKDPIYFDGKTPMVIMSGPGKAGFIGMLQGYAFPRMAAAGTVELDGKTVGVKGDVWFEHWMGRPDGAAMANFVMIEQRLSDGGDLFIAMFYDAAGNLKNTHMLIRKAAAQDFQYSKKISLSPIRDWTSPFTFTVYNIGWKLKGIVNGTVEAEAGAENSEIMIDQGIGGFWLGPCRFKGKIDGMGEVTGEGFCRSVSSVEKKP